ncbi:MAG: flagellar motor stator protein MotA [Bryobacterales bacterium]|nr:flagellar motor stator protein MotA [Bryobacteraceae bacterium]MDW8130961.1 flagellar motor stator protein MotA [Bryobacterales bacterium]
MTVILGLVIVIASVLGGYLLAHGKLLVLVQPAEFVVILGAATGALVAANPPVVTMGIFKGLASLIKGSPYTKAFYLETLKMLSDLFNHARKNGLARLEQDIEEPAKSPVFSKYPRLLNDHHALSFVCDTLRVVVAGGVQTHDLDQMIELDLDVHHHSSAQPAGALSTMADSLPGLGIVAAVLGIIITMGAMGGPPEQIGHKVAAALVGTFLGVLMCYGFIGPLAAHMNKLADAETQYYHVLRAGLMAFAKGLPPLIAVEFARRTVPVHLRPSFKEMESAFRGAKAATGAAA